MAPRDDSPVRGESPRKRRRMKSNNDDFKLFEGLSEAERRQIRKEQRKIQERLQTENSLDEVRKDNNKIFKGKVRFTREAVLDSDNCNVLASKFVQQIEQNVQVPRYDAHKLVNALKRSCSAAANGNTFFDWTTLGREAGVCFNSIPSRCAFAAGRWDNPAGAKKIKKRAPRERYQDDNAKEVKPEEQTAHQSSDQSRKPKESAAEANIKKIERTLKKRSEEEIASQESNDVEALRVPGVPFLFNPKSFTQTVENIFYFSFLVKKGKASAGMDEDGGFFVGSVYAQEPETDRHRQAVCSLTLRDWRRLCKQHLSGSDTGDLPHRTPPAGLITRAPTSERG